MCGICITNNIETVKETLRNQTDRGLDGLGIITEQATYRASNYNYKGYKRYIKSIKDRGIKVMHHRKASIGNKTLDNVHPFKGERFQLMHNGTSHDFFDKYSKIYPAQTDSEVLLKYIEAKTDNIYEVPAIIQSLSDEIGDDFGNVIVVDRVTRKVLFYSDGARESYIDVRGKNLVGIYNYKPGKKEGYDNQGYIIFDFDLNISINTFDNINKEMFYNYYSGRLTKDKYRVISTKKYTGYTGSYTNGNYNSILYGKNEGWGNYDYVSDFGWGNIEEEEKNEEAEEYNSMLEFIYDFYGGYTYTKTEMFKDYIFRYEGVGIEDLEVDEINRLYVIFEKAYNSLFIY